MSNIKKIQNQLGLMDKIELIDPRSHTNGSLRTLDEENSHNIKTLRNGLAIGSITFLAASITSIATASPIIMIVPAFGSIITSTGAIALSKDSFTSRLDPINLFGKKFHRNGDRWLFQKKIPDLDLDFIKEDIVQRPALIKIYNEFFLNKKINRKSFDDFIKITRKITKSLSKNKNKIKTEYSQFQAEQKRMQKERIQKAKNNKNNKSIISRNNSFFRDLNNHKQEEKLPNKNNFEELIKALNEKNEKKESNLNFS